MSSSWSGKSNFNNQSGIVPKILALLSTMVVNSFWVLSQVGNLGPNFQDLRLMYVSLKGGAQSEEMLKTKETFGELLVIDSCFKLERLEKWASVMPPSHEFSLSSSTTSDESSPRLSGMIPLIWFCERYNSCKEDKLPIDSGIEPRNELDHNWRYLKFLRCPNEFGRFPVSLLNPKSRFSTVL